MVHTVSIPCMVQHISLEYKPIYLGNRRHIYIPVQSPIELVRNMKVDFRLADLLGIYMLQHDFEQSKWHSVHMVYLVHMDSRNDDSSTHDRQDIHNLNCIQFVRIVRMDYPCNRTSIGRQFDDSIQSIQHSQHMDHPIHTG